MLTRTDRRRFPILLAVIAALAMAMLFSPVQAQEGSVPDQPMGLEATATHDSVTLTWDDPGDDTITGYVILRRIPAVDPQGQFSELVSDTGTDATTYTDDTVSAETRYTYRIKAINEHGVSERSRWSHVDVPAAPEAVEGDDPDEQDGEGDGGGAPGGPGKRANVSEPSDGDCPGDVSTTCEVDVGGSVTGNISSRTDFDWFRVDLEADTRYQIDLEGEDTGRGTLPDPVLELYDGAGSFETDNETSGVGDNAREIYTPTATGTYYVGTGEVDGETGTYTLSVIVLGANGASEQDTDFPETTATTGRVEVGASATGNLSTITDVDWFKVVLDAGKTYQIDMKGLDGGGGTIGDPYLHDIRDSSGTGISNTGNDDVDADNDIYDSQITYTPTTAGAYYLVAAGAADSGTYTLSVGEVETEEPPCTLNDGDFWCGVVTVGPILSGTNTIGHGYIEFSGISGGSFEGETEFTVGSNNYTFEGIYVSSTGGTTGALNFKTVALFSDDDKEALELHIDVDGTSSTRAISDAVSGVATGLILWTSAGLDWSLATTVTARLRTPPSDDPVDDCPGDTTTTCEVDVGGSATGNIETVTDRDWFKVDLEAGKFYQIDLEGDAGGGGTLEDPYLRNIRDSSGAEISETENDDVDPGSNADSRVIFNPTEAGAYYLVASGYGGASDTGTYTLSVTELETRTEEGGTDFIKGTTTLGLVEVGDSATGEIDPASDIDWFRVVLEYDKTYVFDLEGSETSSGTLANPFLALLDASGRISYFEDDDGGQGLNSRFELTAVYSGIHYLSASKGASASSGGTYTLSVREVLPCALNEGDIWCGVVTVGDITNDRHGFLGTTGGLSDETFSLMFETGTTNNYTILAIQVASELLYFVTDSGLTDTEVESLALHVDGESDPFVWSDSTAVIPRSYRWPARTGLDWSSETTVTLRLREFPRPRVTNVAVTSTPVLETDTYGAGETIEVSVTFSEAVDATSDTDFVLNGGGRQERAAGARLGHGDAGVRLHRGVRATRTTNGIWIGDETRTLVGSRNGEAQSGTITSVATGATAVIAHTALGTQSDHKVDGSRTTDNVGAGETSFTTSATLSIPENTELVFGSRWWRRTTTFSCGTTTTTTRITGYAITGGADNSRTSSSTLHRRTAAGTVVAGSCTRFVDFGDLPSFENPQDSGADNTYEVTVQATSGTGTREMTATRTFTVTVTDVAEQSAKPDKPTLAAVSGSTTSLTATWTKPDLNGGPDITGYDLQYRAGATGTWSSSTSYGATVTTATITGLTADTSYQARVLAKNGETDSDWSDASDAVSTNAAVAMMPLDVLVSNYPDGSGTNYSLNFHSTVGANQRHYFAQTFTAGAGFTLTAVDIPFRRVPDNSRVTVSLHARNGSKPGTYLGELDLSGALAVGDNTFAAPAGTALASGTYFVRVRWRDGDTNSLSMTNGVDDEMSAESGWSIEDRAQYSASGSSWSNWNTPFAMRVRGTIDGVPRVATGGVRIESDPDAHDSYGVGEEIEVAVGFTDDVAVDTTSGTPRVALTVGSNTRYADYSASDSDDDELAFVYTVTEDDHDQDGVSIDDDALELNGGAIHKDGDTSTNAVLDHADLGRDSDHRVNRDPFIVSDGVSVISTPVAATDTYGLGEVIEIEVEFSAAVDATTDTDFVLSVGGAKRAPLLRGSGTATLVFGYTVVASDDDDSGIWIGEQDRTLVGNRNGEPQNGEITSAVTDREADLDHDSPGVLSGHKVDGSLSDLPTLSIGNASGDEGSSISFPLTLSAAAGGLVAVNCVASFGSGDTAVAADLSNTAAATSIRPGEVAGSCSFSSVQDSTDEEDETFTVTLSGVSSNAQLAADPTAKGTIDDDDAPPTVDIADATAIEGDDVEFTVTLSAASEKTVTVRSSGSVDPGDTASDADFASGFFYTTIFDPGQDEKTVTVQTVDDVLDEDAETFTLEAGELINVRAGDIEATGTITDNDPTPTVTVADAAATEGDKVEFTVTLSAVSGRDVEVGYATSVATDDTAVSGTDFTAATGTLTILAADSTATGTVEVQTTEDDATESAETFTLTLSATKNVDLGTPSTAKGTINDVSEGNVAVLLSNLGQDTDEFASAAVGAFDAAQGFTTGSARSGYFLDSIKLDVKEVPNTPADVTVQLWSASNGNPDASIATLTHSTGSWDTGVNTFSASPAQVLAATTKYFVVLLYSGARTYLNVNITQTDSADDASTEWEVTGRRLERGSDNQWKRVSGQYLKFSVGGRVTAEGGTDLPANATTSGVVEVDGSAARGDIYEPVFVERTGDDDVDGWDFDTDWFAVELEEGRTYRIDMEGAIHADDDDLTLRLPQINAIYNEDGEFLVNTWSRDESDSHYLFRVTFHAHDDGTYYIAASGESHEWGTYKLRVKDITEDDDEHTAAQRGLKNLRAVEEKGGVKLTWQPPDGAAVTGYRIERRRAGGQDSGPQRSHGQPRDHHTLVEDTGNTETSYVDESAEQGVEYEYRVTARNESGPGEESDWVRAGPASASNNPATGAPTISGTTQVGETLTADISGIADADGLSGETFTYQWVSSDGTTDTDIENANGSTYTLIAADQGKSVKVSVTFTDGGGNEETLTSAPTDPVWGDGRPGAPRNLAATAGNREVTLSWDPPADNGNAPATGYRIEWRVDGKDYDKTIWGTARSTTYTTNVNANLANGVKYFFRVSAGNGSGNSYGPYGPASGEVSATPTSGSAVDLGTPVLSNTENLHHGMVRLDWQDVEDAGWYVVQYYHVEDGEWLDLPAEGVDIVFHGSSAVVSNLHGLSWLRVGAMSCAGASEWSQIEQLFGTNASDWEGVPVPEVEEGDEIEPCPVVLGTPVLSDTETLHHGMVQLDWQDIEDAGWYVVQYYHVKSGEWLDLPAEGVDIAFHGSSAVVSNLHGLSWLRVGAASCDGASEWSQIEQSFGTNASDWEDVPVPEVAEGDEIEPCSEDADTSDNSPATGAPTISGTAQVGQTLTANTSGIADADGLSNVQYEYQWLADDSDISGATNATYTLADTDEGKAIKVQVGFTDDTGNGETLTSAATDAVAAAPTPNTPATGAPTISGTAQVGETLTADTSGIADADGLSSVQYEYQWLADDADISGATNATYTLTDSEESKAITVQVSFTDDADNEETLTSAATDVVAGAQPTEPPDKPTGLDATATHDSVTLTWDDPGDDSITGYVILRRIPGVDPEGHFDVLVADTGTAATTYTDDTVSAETRYTYRIKAINGAGTSERSRWSHIDTPAAPVPDKPTGLEATESDGQVVLTWDDPGDDSITGYVILRRVRENDTGGDFSVLVADTGSAATTYTDNTVAANTTYTYRIKAINEHGTSERSRWYHIDIPAAP